MYRFTLLLVALLFGTIQLSAQAPSSQLSKNALSSDISGYLLSYNSALETAYLMTPNGRYVHSWSFQQGLTWDHVELLPKGNLLVIVKDRMVLELDWDSHLIWKSDMRAHSDLSRQSPRKTFVLSRSKILDPWESGRQLTIDRLMRFDKQGKIQASPWTYESHHDEISALLKINLEERLEFKTWPALSSVEQLPTNAAADQDKRFRSGNLLLCAQHANFIAIVHRNNEKVLWAWGTDELVGPTYASMLPTGNILIFDSGQQGNKLNRRYSRVLELNPITEEIVWEYQASNKTDFFSPEGGSAMRLENGHTLITERGQANILEVDEKNTIISSYASPDLDRRFIPRVYPLSEFTSIFEQEALAPDFSLTEWKEINRRRIDQAQYKRLNRETIAQIELGYWDAALKFQQIVVDSFPEDDEGLFLMSVLQTQLRNFPKAMEYVRLAAKEGFPLERYQINLGGLLTPLLERKDFQEFIKTQPLSPLVHGPMLGKLAPNSASVWLRSNGEQTLSIHVQTGEGKMVEHSALFSPKAKDDYTYEFTMQGLEAGKDYAYEIWVGNRQVGPRHHFRTPPDKGEAATFALGFGGGAGYTPWNERIWDTLSRHKLDLFLAMGDNVYIDHPERPITQRFCYFRRQSRPEYRQFVGSTAQYAIWDDHDFTYNDERGGPATDQPYWKRDVLSLFQQQWINPSYGGGDTQPGIWFDFSYGDVDFFLLDCRYYRENPKGNPSASMLGPVQKQWLKDRLKASTATFKIIGSSVPWAEGTKPGSLDTWDGHPQEREEIFSFLESEKIEGVVLISADRHRSDAWRIERPNGYPLHDFMSSRLTNVHVHKVMPGALFGYNKTPSFGILEFDTTKEDPRLSYRVMSIDNEEVHRLTLYRSQLEFGN